MLKFQIKLVEPVEVVLKDSNGYRYQEQLLLEQKYKALDMIDQANKSLDSKAAQLLQASGLIVALIGVLSIPNFITSGPTVLIKIGTAAAFLAFMGMIGLSLAAWSPGEHDIPGIVDWDKMYNQYIYADRQNTYSQILADCIGAIKSLESVNHRKGNLIKWSAFLFLIEVGGLMIVALLA